MDPFYRECELTKPVSDYFISRGFTVVREVPIGYCRADIVAFKNGVVAAVELKLHDRKKALIQAKNYQLGADLVYLAVPLMASFSLLRKSEHLLRTEGIGLLVVNEETCKASLVLEARPSSKKFASVTLHEIVRRRNQMRLKFKVY